jgi:hypothetical protein
MLRVTPRAYSAWISAGSFFSRFALLIEEAVVGIQAGVERTDPAEFAEHDGRKQMIHRGRVSGMLHKDFFEVLGGAVIVGVIVILEAASGERIVLDGN